MTSTSNWASSDVAGIAVWCSYNECNTLQNIQPPLGCRHAQKSERVNNMFPRTEITASIARIANSENQLWDGKSPHVSDMFMEFWSRIWIMR
jgi:hypothetical protein